MEPMVVKSSSALPRQSHAAVAPAARRKKQLSRCVTLYLVVYNVVSVSLWTLVTVRSLQHIYALAFGEKRSVAESLDGVLLWNAVGLQLTIVQSVALLEVPHALAQWTGAGRNVVTLCLQLLSRLQFVWIIWMLVAQSREGPCMAGVVLAWGFAEIFKYLYYALQLCNQAPWILKWLRYSGFLILYPIGITFEAVTVYRVLPALYSHPWLRRFPHPMPNSYNFEISMYYVFILVLVVYVPGSFHLYGHMLRLRRKALSSTPEEEGASLEDDGKQKLGASGAVMGETKKAL